ncbi:MAG: zinc-binding alcohol dehydrogenase family protein [Prevotella sp.]|nr:zinc-binding alcohol dehydrogenase family protein [Prevotella sp.]
MKAIQITEPRVMKVVDMDTPQCQAGEVLLKIHYVGFCGSDLNTFRGLNQMAKPQVIPGHEIGAEIIGLGAEVPPTLRKGMIVTVNPYTSCGVCSACRSRRYNACEHNETLGVQRDGAMREYLAVPWQKVIPVGDITPAHAALIEPMSVGFHAVSRAQAVDTDVVMIIGCGMVGVGAVIRSLLRGAKVIACDVDDEKLDIVKRLGADYTINSAKENVHERLMELTDSMGPNIVIEAVGSPATYQTAVNEVAFCGRVICIGYSKQDVEFTTKYFVQKELDIRGSRNALPEDFDGVIRYLKKYNPPYDVLTSGIVKPEQAEQAMVDWDKNPAKVFRILVDFT